MKWKSQQRSDECLLLNLLTYECFCVIVYVETYRNMKGHKMNNTIQETMKTLKPGEKYTLLVSNGFGFVYDVKVVLKSVENIEYAQYKDAVRLTYRAYRKRKDEYHIVHKNKLIAVFEGWMDLYTDMFGESQTNSNGVTVQRSRYSSCDNRYFTDAIESAGCEPVAINNPFSELVFK